MSGPECERCGDYFLDCRCDDWLGIEQPKSTQEWVDLQSEIMLLQLQYCQSPNANLDTIHKIIGMQLEIIKKILKDHHDDKV